MKPGQFTQNNDGSFETVCRQCYQPLLFFPGDRIVVIAGDGFFVECSPCWKKFERAEVCDGAWCDGDDPDFPPVTETTK